MENGNDTINNAENTAQVDTQEPIQCLLADPVAYWEQGITWFVQALRKNPVFAEKIIDVLQLHVVQEKLQAEQRKVAQLLYEQLQIARVEGLQTRLSMFEQLCAMDFLSLEARSYAFAFRGECYLDAGNYEDALTDFDYALTLNTQDAYIINKRGQTYLQMGMHQEAVLDFDRASELGEENVLNRGKAYLSTKHYQEALELYDQAIASNPHYADMWCDKGRALEKLERYEEALVAYDEAIRLSLEYSDAWYNKGSSLEKLQRYEEALSNYDQAIKLNPRHVDAWYNKGMVLGKLRRYKEKRAAYNEVIRLNPQFTSKQAPSEAKKSAVSPELVSAEYLDTEIVILLQGTNLFGQRVYSYVLLTGRRLKRMFAMMQAGENFKPANFGTVITAGIGEPSQEVRDEMKRRYDMIDVPAPSSTTKTVPRTWVEKVKEARK
jgi:tetratricopeptide (TPR) repeat protein